MGQPRETAAELLRLQAAWCERLGSPLYATLLGRAATDAEAGGPTWTILAGRETEPRGSALALRFMAAVHWLVLSGDAPALAQFYPSAGGSADAGDPWPAFRATLEEHAAVLRTLVGRACQTNEVGRSAALVGGFLEIAARTELPMRLLEIGSSAGLNLRWDHYQYEAAEWGWGDASSPVRFTDVFSGSARPRAVPVDVVARAGCDAEPVDPTTAGGRLTLLSATWPDQARRFRNLKAALDVAAGTPVPIERADAPDWLAARLAEPPGAAVTVVFHSIVVQYLGRERRERVRELITDAGRRSTLRAPLAHLRLEPTGGDPARGEFLVHLTEWPSGEERLLARAHAHGPPVDWLA